MQEDADLEECPYQCQRDVLLHIRPFLFPRKVTVLYEEYLPDLRGTYSLERARCVHCGRVTQQFRIYLQDYGGDERLWEEGYWSGCDELGDPYHEQVSKLLDVIELKRRITCNCLLGHHLEQREKGPPSLRWQALMRCTTQETKYAIQGVIQDTHVPKYIE